MLPENPESRSRRTPHAKETRDALLDALSHTGNVTMACEQVGVPRQTAYDWRADTEYAVRWDQALKESTERLEAEARRRAYEGVDQPVWYQGEMVGTEKRYSDTLMIQLLKAHHPAHRETVKHQHTHAGEPGAAPIQVEHSADTDDLLETLKIVQEVADDGGS